MRVLVDLTAGGEYTRNFIVDRHFQISDDGQQGSINTDNEFTLNQYSIFAQAKVDFTNRTSFTAGAGFSGGHYRVQDLFEGNRTDASGNRTFDLVFSPRAALLHQFSDQISIYANASTGFTPPTVSEISVRDGTINTDLNAKKSYNIDIGSRGTLLFNRLRYDLAFFSLRMKDSFIPPQRSGFTYYVNAGQLTNTGMELLLRYNVLTFRQTNGWNISGFLNYGYNHTRFDDYTIDGTNYSGNEVTGISPDQLALGFDVQSSFGGYAHAVYRFVGKRPITDANSVYDGSYSLLNGKIGIKHKLSDFFDFEVYAGLNNVLDTLYSPVLALN